MIKNIILDVGKVLVAWEPEDAMKQLGFDDKTVKAVADATVNTPVWPETDVVSGQMNRSFRHFMRRHRNIKRDRSVLESSGAGDQTVFLYERMDFQYEKRGLACVYSF